MTPQERHMLQGILVGMVLFDPPTNKSMRNALEVLEKYVDDRAERRLKYRMSKEDKKDEVPQGKKKVPS